MNNHEDELWVVIEGYQVGFSSSQRAKEKGQTTSQIPFDLPASEVISDCNAMNYTQMAFEINFYFGKFNMLWILRVTIDISRHQPLFIHFAICFSLLLSSFLYSSAFCWGRCKQQFTIANGRSMSSWKIINMKNGKTNKLLRFFFVSWCCRDGNFSVDSTFEGVQRRIEFF